MEDKAYIVIDDESQTERMTNKIDKIISQDGYNIKSIYINPNDRDFWDNEKNLDLLKMISRIKELSRTHHINVIACDYNYSGNKFNGMHVIYELRNSHFVCPVILYSGREADVANGILNTALDTNEKKVRYLEMLLKCRVDRFLQRDYYYDIVIEYLKKYYNYKDTVIKKMEEYPDTIVKFDSGFFEDKTFSEIVKEIKKDTLQGNKFVAEILELAIANFAELNG
jgi:hypothetical protein